MPYYDKAAVLRKRIKKWNEGATIWSGKPSDMASDGGRQPDRGTNVNVAAGNL